MNKIAYLRKKKTVVMEIFDPIRRKMVARTPEEEVRQQLIAWLVADRKVPQTLMRSEFGFEYNGRRYRADILVFDRSLRPLMLVECKAPEVRLDESVIDLVLRYNRTLQVKYILISNGKTAYLCSWDAAAGHYVTASAVPAYPEMIEE